MRAQRQNPFPAAATMDGNQVLSGTCSESVMIRLVTGNLVISVGVVSVPTVGMPLEFTLTYNSRDDLYGPVLGHLWRHNYMMGLNIASNLVTFSGPDGRRYPFNWDSGSSSWKQNPDSFFLPATLVDGTTEWRLEFQDGRKYHFEHPTSGAARLTGIVDPNGNQTTVTWSTNQTRIAEPRGREIVLDYYTSGSYTGFLEKITDPRGKVTTLFYTGGSGSEKLWKVMGPQGCTLEYSYKTGTNLIEKRTDPRSKELTFEYYGATDPYPDRLKKVIDAERNGSGQIDPAVTGELLYAYDTVLEDIANGPAPQATLFRTKLTDARGKLWEYRFDPSGNLWRVIDPLGRHTRNYWSSHQRLLFTTAGFPPATETTLGPVENWNNSFWRRVVDERGNLLQSLDPSGLLTEFSYDATNRLKSVTPGRAHFGVKGNWVGEYGSDGWILCGFDNGTDRHRLPGYVSAVSSVAAEPFVPEFVANFRGIIEASAPVGRDASQNPPKKEPLPERQVAFWKPSTTGASQFSFKVEMVDSTPKSFNLSLYAHSADLASNTVPGTAYLNPYPFAPLNHHEQYGRALVFKVTDLDGVREFTLPSDGAGVWTTFAVRGSSATHVEVQVKALAPYNTSARLAAVAFDPVQDRTTSLGYDSFGNLTQSRDPLGNTTSLQYWDPTDATGPGYRLLKQVTDPRGKVTKFFYTDAARNLTRVEDPAQKSTQLTYDSNSNVLTVQDANSYTTTFTYDDKNRPLTITDQASNQTVLGYDDAGNLATSTDPQSRVTTFAYTNMNRLKTVTDDDNNVWTLAWDKAGNLVSAKDPRNNETTFEYDDAGQLIRVVQPDTQKVEAAYDALGRLSASVTPNGTQTTVANIPTTGLRNVLTNPGGEEQDPYSTDPEDARFWNYPSPYRDSSRARTGSYSLRQEGNYGRSYHVPTPNVPGVPLLAQGYFYINATDWTYDAAFRLEYYGVDGSVQASEQSAMVRNSGYPVGWRKVGPVRFNPNSTAQRSTARLGIFGQATGGSSWEWLYWDDLELLPLGTGYLYDSAGRLAQVVQPDGSIFRLEHDRFGNVSRTIDALGRATTFQYDGLDRLVKVTDPLGNAYELTYNAAGDLASFKEPGLTSATAYDYDDVGRLWKITYPDASTEIFTYRDNGDLLTYTDTAGRVFTFAYDTADRLWKVTYPDTQTVEFTYGAAGYVATRKERNGDLSSFTRNDLYQVTTEVMTPGAGSSTPAWTHENSFDAAGNRLSLKTGSSSSVYGTGTYGTSTYGPGSLTTLWSVPTGLTGYDAMNRLKRFADQDGQNTDFAYDFEGRRKTITYPNGAVTQAEYDFLGRLLSLTTTRSGATLLALTYGYDANGNRVKQVAGDLTFDYHLDDADRLVGESINCWSVRTAADLRRGTTNGTETVSSPGKLLLLKWDDTFSGGVLNLDRWRPVVSETDLQGFRIRQQEGLHLVFPEGYTTRTFAQDPPIVNNYGVSLSPVWCGVEHRRLLSGDFTVQVQFDKFQQVTTAGSTWWGNQSGRVRIGLLVDSQPTELRGSALAAVYRTVDPGGIGDVWESQIQPGAPPATVATLGAAAATAGWLRIQRLSGQLSTWYSTDGTNWTPVGVSTTFTGDNLRVALLLEATYAPAAVRFLSFSELAQNDYPASATYESEVYDSGQNNAAWDTLTWTENLPSGTDVTVDVAVQNSMPFGTWNYSGGYTNPAGSSLAGRTGRYLRYRVTLAGGTATPEASRFRLTHGTSWQDRSYGFDGRGNMTSKEVISASGTVSEARTFNDLNQVTQNVVGSTTWIYTWIDGSGKNPGNLLQKKKSDNSEIWDYTWNEDNRLTRVVKTVNSVVVQDVAYTYDSLGRMLTRKLSTDTDPTRFEWDGWDLVREVDPAGVETVYYAPQGEIFSFKRGTSVYQVHPDALGSISSVTDLNGSVAAAFSYDGWGTTLSSAGPLASTIAQRFVGSWGVLTDLSFDLLYMRNRWYDPAIARFISRDPLRDASNRYAYSRNQPLDYIDPEGLQEGILNPPTGIPTPEEIIQGGKAILEAARQHAISIGRTVAAGVSISTAVGAAAVAGGGGYITWEWVRALQAEEAAYLAEGTAIAMESQILNMYRHAFRTARSTRRWPRTRLERQQKCFRRFAMEMAACEMLTPAQCTYLPGTWMDPINDEMFQSIQRGCKDKARERRNRCLRNANLPNVADHLPDMKFWPFE